MGRKMITRYTATCPRCRSRYEVRVFKVENSGDYDHLLHITDGCPLCVPDEEEEPMKLIKASELAKVLEERGDEMLTESQVCEILDQYSDLYFKEYGFGGNLFRSQKSTIMEKFREKHGLDDTNPQTI